MTNKAKLLIIFALVYFFSPNGLSSLPNLPIAYLLKEVLKLTATQAAYFSAITILGWAIKPLWGLISDTLPIFGSRRKNYLILASVIASLCWLILALTHNYTIGILLLILTLSSFAYAFQDVVVDAYMIETAKKEPARHRYAQAIAGGPARHRYAQAIAGGPSRHASQGEVGGNALAEFQSIQWLAVSVAQILTGFLGGWVAAKLTYQTNFGIAIFFPLIIVALALFLLKENSSEIQFPNLKHILKLGFFNKEFLLITLFLLLWNFSPSFGAPFFYYRVDELHLTKIFLGVLASMAAFGSALGAIIFKFVSKKIKFKKLLIYSILISGIGTFFSLIYLLPSIKSNLMLVEIISIAEAVILGALGMVAFLTMLTFAAQKTEAMVVGTMFAFLTAVINLGSIGSQVLGGFLYEKIGLAPLIFISGITSLLILIFVPFLKTE